MIFKWNPWSILKQLIKYIFKNWNKEFLICAISEKEIKEIRRLAQNRGLYLLFNWISGKRAEQ